MYLLFPVPQSLHSLWKLSFQPFKGWRPAVPARDRATPAGLYGLSIPLYVPHGFLCPSPLVREKEKLGSQGPYFKHEECGFQSSAKYELPRYNTLLNYKCSASSTLFHTSAVLNTTQTCSFLKKKKKVNIIELLSLCHSNRASRVFIHTLIEPPLF